MRRMLKDLGRYLRRPIILFCFGGPLLLPAILLTVVAYLQDHISTTLHVLGIFFLFLSVLSIASGMALGLHSVCCSSNTQPEKRPTTKGFQRVDPATRRKAAGGGKSSKNRILVSPQDSVPSSQSSSRRSTVSLGSVSHVVVTNETVRLVPYLAGRKGRKHRRGLVWPSRTPIMPSLQEEENPHPPPLAPSDSSSPVDSQGTTPPSKVERADSINTQGTLQKLEKHLREIGLGQANRRMAQSPVDVEALPVTNKTSAAVAASPVGNRKSLARSNTLPEGEFQGFEGRAEQRVDAAGLRREATVVCGSAQQEEMLRRAAVSARERHPPDQQQQPMFTTESHERTGISCSMSNTML